ncbi:MAG: Bifunctional protein Aas [Verrucomicrobia subdivision 3 bacterium]|nr:Bifunctional protein Aas [Limisphaerales bacterium]MCS1414607.1 Bifunctional protein Aas [Limisphaerales bacterium]
MTTIVRFIFQILFRFRAYGQDGVDVEGPVLLIPNHVSWIDFLFLGVCLDKDWRFVTSSTTAETSWLHRRIMRSRRAFPVNTTSPYSVKHIAKHLNAGGRLVLFAEGRISTTGSLMKLFEGTGFLLLKTKAKIITCYIRGANRLRCTRHDGWKQWFPKITVHFSEVQSPPSRKFSNTVQGRKTLTAWLRDRLVEQRLSTERDFGPRTVLDSIIENRYQRPGFSVLEDMTFTKLSYRKLLAGIEILAAQWPSFISSQRQPIGVLLPSIKATPVAITSFWVAGLTPALLNFSTGIPTLLTCCDLANIYTVVTSKRFLKRAKLDLAPLEQRGIRLLFLEDVRAQVGTMTRLRMFLKQALFRPFQDFKPALQDTAVILFTSGSEGVPKGVELSHANLMANIQQMLSVIDITDSDRVFNALPMFHSFGLTIGTLLPLVRGIHVFLYPSPLHYRMVPAVIYDRRCTIMLSTNTFLNGYARKAHAYDFNSIRYLFAGAEKTQETTFETWAQKYGIRILEGYGTTECSPCISVNTGMEVKIGSAGRLLPAIQHRLETIPGVDKGGRLHIRGPNVMKGYLNPEANQEFQALEGWYDTGDIADIDDEGYVYILGRLKRFAKVSGEMISLSAVEESLAGKFNHHGLRTEVAILSRPDSQRGEQLIAVSNNPAVSLTEIRETIKAGGHSNLSIPRQLEVVKEIPKLGTGKVDHRNLQKSLEKSASAEFGS